MARTLDLAEIIKTCRWLGNIPGWAGRIDSGAQSLRLGPHNIAGPLIGRKHVANRFVGL